MNTTTKPDVRRHGCRPGAPFYHEKQNYAGVIAVVMLVLLALISTIRGQGIQAGGSVFAKQGYLQVYSATDAFDDGGVLYYAHSSYNVYTIDGKFCKAVENHISRSDEIPELVTLPAGSYIVEARSENRGYLRVRVTVKAGRLAILDLDLAEKQRVAQLVLLHSETSK